MNHLHKRAAPILAALCLAGMGIQAAASPFSALMTIGASAQSRIPSEALTQVSQAEPLPILEPAVSAPAVDGAEAAPVEPESVGGWTPSGSSGEIFRRLNGRWAGSLPTKLSSSAYYLDPIELNIVDDAQTPKLFITIQSYDAAYMLPNSWKVSKEGTTFTFNEGTWEATVTLSLAENDTKLAGTVAQYDKVYEFELYRMSSTPDIKDQQEQYLFEGEPPAVWAERLAKYPSFGTGSDTIPFTYELYEKEKIAALLNAADFANTAVKGYSSDVAMMQALLEVFCDRFPHDGASGMPEQTDVISILNYADQAEGIECRGQAAMFSAILRAYGIPARVVMCLPYTDPCEDCHVIVHAWSSDLGQWVMIDPTYRLMLRDQNRSYLSIPQVRDALVSGQVLVANETAGHNRAPFSMEYYRAYMTKNMFRFSSRTNACFEGDNAAGNRDRLLVPLNYQVQYPWSRPEIVTTNADAFWAAPIL